MLAIIFSLFAAVLAAPAPSSSRVSLVIESNDTNLQGKGVGHDIANEYVNLYVVSDNINTFNFDPQTNYIFEYDIDPSTGDKVQWNLFHAPRLNGVILGAEGVMYNYLAIDNGYVGVNGTTDIFHACMRNGQLTIIGEAPGVKLNDCSKINIRANIL